METEKRIKQLEGRLAFLRGFIVSGHIEAENSFKASTLIKKCRAEYDRLTKQKSF